MWTRMLVLLSRCRALFTRRRLDHDFDQELQSHLAMLTEENVRRGLSPAEAARQARVRLGGVVQLEERHRDESGLPFVETTVQDLRYAVRTFRKNPAYAAVAIATLAIGIGAGTTVYSLAGAVLLRPLPYAEPDRLVRVFETNPLRNWTRNIASPANYADWKSASEVIHRHGGLRAVQFDWQRRLGCVPDRIRRAASAEVAWRHRQSVPRARHATAPRPHLHRRGNVRRQSPRGRAELWHVAEPVCGGSGHHRQIDRAQRTHDDGRRRHAPRLLLPRQGRSDLAAGRLRAHRSS